MTHVLLGVRRLFERDSKSGSWPGKHFARLPRNPAAARDWLSRAAFRLGLEHLTMGSAGKRAGMQRLAEASGYDSYGELLRVLIDDELCGVREIAQRFNVGEKTLQSVLRENNIVVPTMSTRVRTKLLTRARESGATVGEYVIARRHAGSTLAMLAAEFDTSRSTLLRVLSDTRICH